LTVEDDCSTSAAGQGRWRFPSAVSSKRSSASTPTQE
jgi:hypothetical protein